MSGRAKTWALLVTFGLMGVFIAASLFAAVHEHASGRVALERATKQRDGALDAVTYSCGFLAGQNRMIKAAGLKVAPNPESERCAEARANAALNGFTGGQIE